jgi:hypothetical protein
MPKGPRRETHAGDVIDVAIMVAKIANGAAL